MRWTPGGMSRDVEDRRSVGAGRIGGRVPIGIGGILFLFVLGLIFKQDFLSMFFGGGSGVYETTSQPDPARDAKEQPQVEFVSFVLDDAQNTWEAELPQYRRAKLVLFRDAVDSACGTGTAATGPFYCPGDERVYIDLGFFDELRTRFGAPGEFAEAYVLAHEIGHHVQKVTGIESKVRAAMQSDPRSANALSVRLELQADCFAGVWGNSTQQRNLLETGDVEEGLNAAAAVGDDRIQKMATGRVMPDKFTHGSSAQRTEWFRKGFTTGDVNACNTFGATQARR
jgi:uncharacterized protein